MEWQDHGIILATRPFGESGLIVEVMTRGHGRAAGLVRAGRSRRMRPVMQPGNGIGVKWRGRLEDQLGTFDVEPAEARAGRLLETRHGAFGLQWLTALMRVLPEREPSPRLHDIAGPVLDAMDAAADAGEAAIRFELAFLEDMGFGLDLARCAATGRTDDLAYVSPRTGRAVSREPAAPYRERLLVLPGFLAGAAGPPDRAALEAGFALSGFFLERHLVRQLERPMPAGRDRFVAAVLGPMS